MGDFVVLNDRRYSLISCWSTRLVALMALEYALNNDFRLFNGRVESVGPNATGIECTLYVRRIEDRIYEIVIDRERYVGSDNFFGKV